MPRNPILANAQWDRYVYCRDTAHIDYLLKARRCEDYVNAKQWDPAVTAQLNIEKRPWMTLNKTLVTLLSMLGEQIDLRTEIAFKGRYGAPSGNADILTKVFRYISDKNQLNWVRSEMFADGVVTSRGYVDVRMNFDKSIAGDVQIVNENPRNILPDPDASEYDPDQWNDVFKTCWYRPDDIAHLYNETDAEALKTLGESSYAFGYDSVDQMRDRFGGTNTAFMGYEGDTSQNRMIRVLDRQYKKLTKRKFFVNIKTGDVQEIPHTWDDNKIAALVSQSQGMLVVDERPCHRIRWTITAEQFVLWDDWSPYNHFTIIPYFPFFRYGTTIGMIENLLDPQDLLNKSISQELHIVNSTANGGWKVKQNALRNMTADELEERGAQTGLVMELDDIANAEKITANSIPAGLDRLSMKAENFVKSISGRGDAQLGMTRADVSADQIEANKLMSDIGMKKPLDNLSRTDYFMARNVLALVQEYYTDPRILEITNDDSLQSAGSIQINWPDPESGEIQNDMSMGSYDIVVINQPAKATLEMNQFEQAAYMKEKLGVQIPDEVLIKNSILIDKTDIIRSLQEQAASPEAQRQKEINRLGQELQVAELKTKASDNEASAVKKRADAALSVAKAQKEANGEPGEQEKAQQEMQLEQQKHDQEMAMEREKHQFEMQRDREKAALDFELKKKEADDKRMLMRAEALLKMKQSAQNPQGQQKPQGASQ